MADGEIVEVANIAVNPQLYFQMDILELMATFKGREDQIVAVWHTHPSGSSDLSFMDLKSIEVGAIWPNWKYIIATADEVKEYDFNDICV